MIYPIESSLEDIKQALAGNKNLILTAEPGAGKSTVVPLALINEAWLEGKKIVMLQPRRVAAVAVANRMAETHGSEPGKTVGYSVRFNSNIKPSTKIEVLTEGILTKRIQKDPFLEDVGLVIFDEFHERSINADLGLALCCEIKKDVRPDLRIMVMSATIDTELINNYLENSEVISGKGFLYPVTVEYRPVGAGRNYFDNAAKAIYEIVASSDKKEEYLVFLPGIGEINRVKDYLESTSLGLSHNILTLHGSMNIKDQQRVLSARNNFLVKRSLQSLRDSSPTSSSNFGGALGKEEDAPQKQSFGGAAERSEAEGAALRSNAVSRIILSTNIAETSLTIEGITTVIDTGYARQNQFNAETGLNKLEMVRISKASAKQRAGRAGRLKAGRAIRLYSKAEFENFAENEIPEILRSDPTSSILELYSWGIKDPFKFNWLESPTKESIERSIELLKMLGAIDEKKSVTELGKKINSIPAEPRLAAMLIKAKEAGCLEEAALATAIIEEKDFLNNNRHCESLKEVWQSNNTLFFKRPPQSLRDSSPTIHGGASKLENNGSPNSFSNFDGASEKGVDPDLFLRLLAFEDKSALPSQYSLDNQIMKRILKEQQQLFKTIMNEESGTSNLKNNYNSLRKVLFQAFPDRICQRRTQGGNSYTLCNGQGLSIDSDSLLKDCEYILSLKQDTKLRSSTSDGKIFLACKIELDWLLQSSAIKKAREIFFSEKINKICVKERIRYGSLLLKEQESKLTEKELETALDCFCKAILADKNKAFDLNEKSNSSFIGRLNAIKATSYSKFYPDIDEKWLKNTLASICSTDNLSFDWLQKQGISSLYLNQLSWKQREDFEKLVPERIKVPTGSNIKIDYTQSEHPVLPVKMQEMFGQAQSPSICNGEIKLTVHLLSPAGRPMQITSDLASFWQNGYKTIVGELRGRYPKHLWPDDPANTKPTRLTKPKV